MRPLVFSEPGESFASVCRRLNVVSRVITLQEWILDGAYDEAHDVARDLEDELQRAIKQNEREIAA